MLENRWVRESNRTRNDSENLYFEAITRDVENYADPELQPEPSTWIPAMFWTFSIRIAVRIKNWYFIRCRDRNSRFKLGRNVSFWVKEVIGWNSGFTENYGDAQRNVWHYFIIKKRKISSIGLILVGTYLYLLAICWIFRCRAKIGHVLIHSFWYAYRSPWSSGSSCYHVQCRVSWVWVPVLVRPALYFGCREHSSFVRTLWVVPVVWATTSGGVTREIFRTMFKILSNGKF